MADNSKIRCSQAGRTACFPKPFARIEAVEAHLPPKGAKAAELFLAAQKCHRENPEPPTVEIPVEAKQMRLKKGSAGLKHRAPADIQGRTISLARGGRLDENPCRVNAEWQGKRLAESRILKRDVRGGEPELASTAVTVNNLPAHAPLVPEHIGGTGEVAKVKRLADARRRTGLRIRNHRLDDIDVNAVLPGEPLQGLRVTLPLVAKGEIVTHRDVTRTELLNEDLAYETFRRPRRHPCIKRRNDRNINPKSLKQAKFCTQIGQARERLVGLKVSARMRRKQQNAQWRLARLPRRVNDGLVAPMHTVEVADGERPAFEVARHLGKTSQQSHNGYQERCAIAATGCTLCAS